MYNWPSFVSQVAMATAAKAKLLLRELKTVKADLAFAKERCAQLEDENKLLRENREKGDHRADDDLVFLLAPFYYLAKSLCNTSALTLSVTLMFIIQVDHSYACISLSYYIVYTFSL